MTSDVGFLPGGFLRLAAGPENRKGIILKISHVYKGKACSQQIFRHLTHKSEIIAIIAIGHRVSERFLNCFLLNTVIFCHVLGVFPVPLDVLGLWCIPREIWENLAGKEMLSNQSMLPFFCHLFGRWFVSLAVEHPKFGSSICNYKTGWTLGLKKKKIRNLKPWNGFMSTSHKLMRFRVPCCSPVVWGTCPPASSCLAPSIQWWTPFHLWSWRPWIVLGRKW